MTFTTEETDLDSWRVSNPASIARELFAVERVKFDKSTGLYSHNKSKYSHYVNDNSRLFSKSFLSDSVAIFDYFEGDVESLLPVLFRAINARNSCALFIPSSTIRTKPSARTVDRDANKILMKLLPNKVKRESLELPYKNLIPVYMYCSKSCPYHHSFSEYIDD